MPSPLWRWGAPGSRAGVGAEEALCSPLHAHIAVRRVDRASRLHRSRACLCAPLTDETEHLCPSTPQKQAPESV